MHAILARPELVGVFYSENRLAADAFSTDRLTLLEVLLTYLAISLEGARQYKEHGDQAAPTMAPVETGNQLCHLGSSCPSRPTTGVFESRSRAPRSFANSARSLAGGRFFLVVFSRMDLPSSERVAR